MFRRILRVTLLLVLVTGIAFVGYKAYLLLRTPASDLSETRYLLVPTGSDRSDLFAELSGWPAYRDTGTLRLAADLLGYTDASVKPGRYKVDPGTSQLALLRLLKRGEQSPVNVVLNNERTLPELAAKMDRYLEPDSSAFMETFRDQRVLDSLGLTADQLMTLMIPNTYQLFWNTDTETFLFRMKREHDQFWKKNGRLAKADSLGMTVQEVYTLASIVEKESIAKDERPMIAKLYLNRLQQGMKLQADPTVVFAVGDFTIGRVLFKHLVHESLYNTYLYEGLPPGPICMASINSIDAVLNAPSHNYVYMCAAPETSGRHVFAETYPEHLRNAAVYRRWLDKMGY